MYDSLGTLEQSWAEHGVVQVCCCFDSVCDCVAFRNFAEPQPGELRKDVPHPVRELMPTQDFQECLLVVGLLRVEKTVQVIRVFQDSGLVWTSLASVASVASQYGRYPEKSGYLT